MHRQRCIDHAREGDESLYIDRVTYDPLGLPAGHLLKKVFGDDCVEYTQDDNTGVYSFEWKGPSCTETLVRPFGNGKIMLVCPKPEGDLLGDFKRRLLGALHESAPRQAWCDSDAVRLVLRKDTNGHVYVTAWNLSITDQVNAILSIIGQYTKAEDMCIQGGYEFRPSISDETTQVRLIFGPGEGTIIRLSNR